VPPQGRRETVFYWDVPESDDPRPSPAERAQPARWPDPASGPPL